MNKEKQFYEAPEAEALVIGFEGMICQSGNIGINDWTDDGDPLNC